MSRIESWNRDKCIIDCLQGALQKHCSSLHVTWLVREIVANNIENDKSVFMALLDIKKAYDSVWQDGLFYKLYNIGINGKSWRLLKQLYKGFKCKVRIANLLSEEFEALLGIHQGAPCSLFNHAVYNNDLIKCIKQCMVKVSLFNQVVSCPSFADDMTVISLSKEGLQMLIDLAYHYSKKWRFVFSPTKCKILIFGKDTNPRFDVKLGNHVIDVTHCEKHVGVAISTNAKKQEENMRARIAQCKSVLYGIQAIGSKSVPVTPVVSSKLYKSVCIPKLLYGCEVLNLSPQTIDDLENFHVKAAKIFQCLPDCASNCGSLRTIGWPSLNAYIDMARLLFLWKILILPISNVYKMITIGIIVSISNGFSNLMSSPTTVIIDTCRKYDLFDIVMNSITSGEYSTMTEWKKLIKDKIINYDLKRFKVNCTLNRSLKHLNNDINGITISPL